MKSESEYDEKQENPGDDNSGHVTYNAPATLKMYIAALVTCLGTAAGGTALSYTSSLFVTLVEDPDFNITENSPEISWLGSLGPMGLSAGGLVAGLAADVLGTKRSIHLFSVVTLVGYLLIIMASNIWMIYIGRFLTGMNIGFGAMVTPAYISEISPPSVRGTLGSVSMLAMSCGIFSMYVCGIGLDWRTTAAVAAVVPAILFVAMFFLPESPYWFLRKHRPDEAKQSLLWLRGTSFMKEELVAMESSLDRGSSSGFAEFFKRSSLHPFLICAGLIFFQQFSGAAAVFLYTSSIFAASGSSMDPAVASSYIGAVGILGTILTVVLTDRAGRKILLLASGTGMAVSLTVFGIYYKLVETNGAEATNEKLGWLPLVCLVSFVLSLWIGYGGIPWVLMSELLPPEGKAIGGSLNVFLNGFFGFIVTKFFSVLILWLEQYGTYWLFAGNCVLSLAYIVLYVPETKGKSLQEISELFSSPKESKLQPV